MFKLKPHVLIAKAMLVVLSCFVLSFEVVAGEWIVKSGLNVGQVYTDNVDLEESDKDSELITVVTPKIDVTGKGRRGNVKALATFEMNSAGGDADSFSPRIQAEADAELWEDLLFIEGDIYANQSLIDPFSKAGNSSLNNNDNVTTTYDYSISPYILKHFGRTADLTVRYTYDEQINTGDELSDSTKQSVLGTLASGDNFSRIDWTLTTEYQETSFDGAGWRQ